MVQGGYRREDIPRKASHLGAWMESENILALLRA